MHFIFIDFQWRTINTSRTKQNKTWIRGWDKTKPNSWIRPLHSEAWHSIDYTDLLIYSMKKCYVLINLSFSHYPLTILLGWVNCSNNAISHVLTNHACIRRCTWPLIPFWWLQSKNVTRVQDWISGFRSISSARRGSARAGLFLFIYYFFYTVYIHMHLPQRHFRAVGK